MPYWHIRLLKSDKKSGSTTYSYETDLSETDAKTFGRQYGKGQLVFWEGRWIDPLDIIETLIYQTEDHSSQFETEQSPGSVEIFSGKKGMDVTRLIIQVPPMNRKQEKEKTEKNENLPKISRNIFIVHGRDMAPAYELARIIESLKLNPIILSEQPGGASTIIEKLEKHSDIGFTFILLTPDDIGGLADQDPDLKRRARQNVVLEFGYFMGLLGRDRVYCLYKGNMELPSDMLGVSYAQFNNSIKEVYWYIVRELKAVGYNFDDI
jgi:predicted nucleotide-binding protein